MESGNPKKSMKMNLFPCVKMTLIKIENSFSDFFFYGKEIDGILFLLMCEPPRNLHTKIRYIAIKQSIYNYEGSMKDLVIFLHDAKTRFCVYWTKISVNRHLTKKLFWENLYFDLKNVSNCRDESVLFQRLHHFEKFWWWW